MLTVLPKICPGLQCSTQHDPVSLRSEAKPSSTSPALIMLFETYKDKLRCLAHTLLLIAGQGSQFSGI